MDALNRTVWIARIFGVVVVLVCLILLSRLHTRLQQLRDVQEQTSTR